MELLEVLIRSSGQCGPAVLVAEHADPQGVPARVHRT
jgi:hypothetical protein